MSVRTTLRRPDLWQAFETAMKAAWPGLPPGMTGDEATRRIIAVINALDAAGHLVTPATRAVLDAAKRLRRTDRRVQEVPRSSDDGVARWQEFIDADEAFREAMAAYEAQQVNEVVVFCDTCSQQTVGKRVAGGTVVVDDPEWTVDGEHDLCPDCSKPAAAS